MADTFGPFLWLNQVDFVSHANRIIWAFGLADIAIDAFVSDEQSHDGPPPDLFGNVRVAAVTALDDHHRHASGVQHFI